MKNITNGKLLIDGKTREASNGARFNVFDPSDESLLGWAAEASLDDVSDAIAAARNAFDNTSWSADHAFRKKCLQQLQNALREEADDFKRNQVAEAGVCAALNLLIDAGIEEMSYTIGLIETFDWQRDFPAYEFFGMRSLRRVRYEPYGVVAAITPWNAPFLLNLWKSVPALATGNTVVLKTAPETPLAGAMLGRLILEKTDIPPGVFNVISSSNNLVGGDALTGDPRVDMFHFTGSTGVGQRIAERAARGVRKVVLELGGKSANLLLDDADLDISVPYGANSCMVNSGQGCTLPTRMIVHQSFYQEVVERLKVAGTQISMGDPRDPKTMVGPIIRANQVDRIEGLVNRAIDAGARLITGGKRGNFGGKGHWFEPTILVDVDENSEIAQTEVFGPVLSVIKYADGDEEAIRIANNTPYGLSGFVQSRDVERAMRVANRLRTGTVNINLSIHNSPMTPFGGYGTSGLGREHGIEGWCEFVQTKTISTPAG